jgi:hypothetical protein
MKNKTKQKLSQSLSIKFFLNSQKNFTKIFHQIFKLVQFKKQNETLKKEKSILNLDIDEIKKNRKVCKKIYKVFLVIALMFFMYFIFNLIDYNVYAAVISFSLTIFFLSQTFKYHFYLTQLEHKKLDLTLQEWISIVKRKIKI